MRGPGNIATWRGISHIFVQITNHSPHHGPADETSSVEIVGQVEEQEKDFFFHSWWYRHQSKGITDMAKWPDLDDLWLTLTEWSKVTVSMAKKRTKWWNCTNEEFLCHHPQHTWHTYSKLLGWINCCLGTLDWPSWPPHTEHRVKKLVILKEVVCNQSKMKLNDMVSKIGQYQTSLVSTQLDLIPRHINSNKSTSIHQ